MGVKAKVIFSIVFFTAGLLACNLSRANSAAAGELTYTWVSDSTYAIMFKLYNDCRGNNAASVIEYCAYNTCSGTVFTQMLKPYPGKIQNSTIPNGSEVSFGCLSQPVTICKDVNSTLPGYTEWWYADTVTLPSRCSNWKFSVTYATRNQNNVTQGGNFYIEATLNNIITHQNSSPTFASLPLLFYCKNQSVTHLLNATDADGDSLVYTTVHPLMAPSGVYPPVTSKMGINQAHQYNLSNNPFQTNNTYKLDSTKGIITFAGANEEGPATFSIRVDEYRNGIKVGSMLREMQVYIFKCGGGTVPTTYEPVKVRHYTDTLRGADSTNAKYQIIGCAGQEMVWSFNYEFTDTNAKISVSSDADVVLPGSVVTYTGQVSDVVHGHLRWTPTTTGLHVVNFIIEESVCFPPGVVLRYSHPMEFYVPSGISLGNDTAICAHEAIRLDWQGGYRGYSSDLTWQMLPGSNGTLSCTQCRDAYGNPDPSATYVVTSSAPWCPHIFTDTISVSTLDTPVTFPTVNISVSPSPNIWPGLEAKFTANNSNCAQPAYQWMLNGSDINGATGTTWSSTTLHDSDIISCRLICNDICPSPRDTMSNTILMHVATSVIEMHERRASLYPNPNNGTFTLQLNDDSINRIEIVNIFGQVVHTSEVQKIAVLSLPNLVRGIYTIRISNQKQTYTITFTKS